VPLELQGFGQATAATLTQRGTHYDTIPFLFPRIVDAQMIYLPGVIDHWLYIWELRV
jgi:hypothetical protein